MRRFATAPVMLLGIGIALMGIVYAAPEWTKKTGLDFWHLSDETEQLRAANERTHHLNAFNETEIRRREVCNNVAIALLERRLTLAEAVEAIFAIASASPEWLPAMATTYRANQHLGPMATERDAAKRYLLIKLEMMRSTAECRGDLSQAAAISARLVELNEEFQVDAATCDKLGAR